MLGALHLILSGGIYIPPDILSAADPRHRRRPADPAETGRVLSRRAMLGLTERQVDVLALMMQGKSNKAICRTLDLAEPTVKNHVTAILKALKVTNRTEAVIAVGALGWDLRPVPIVGEPEAAVVCSRSAVLPSAFRS
jgi:DNA-binding NarL/FixJ family response regulator